MAGHGGARNRSGPPPDPSSGRSERRLKAGEKILGQRFGRLPRGGFTGRLPAWPLSTTSAREREVWKQAWRTPQAAAWATEPWRHRSVALWVRATVRCEDPTVPAAMLTATIRLADQIGLTPAGLRENGWEIEEAPGSRAAAEAATPPGPGPAAPPAPAPGTPLRDRLKVVDGAAGGG